MVRLFECVSVFRFGSSMGVVCVGLWFLLILVVVCFLTWVLSWWDSSSWVFGLLRRMVCGV